MIETQMSDRAISVVFRRAVVMDAYNIHRPRTMAPMRKTAPPARKRMVPG